MNTTQDIATSSALGILAKRPVFIDTETTGLNSTAQICEITVLDTDGTVLLDTLVKPTVPISEGAAAVHGIDDEAVANAPTFVNVFEQFCNATRDRLILMYNAKFDIRMIRQTALAHGLLSQLPESVSASGCAMLFYASHFTNSGRWQKLSEAADQQNIAQPDDLHRSLADTELTRRLFHAMAGQAETTWLKENNNGK